MDLTDDNDDSDEDNDDEYSFDSFLDKTQHFFNSYLRCHHNLLGCLFYYHNESMFLLGPHIVPFLPILFAIIIPFITCI